RRVRRTSAVQTERSALVDTLRSVQGDGRRAAIKALTNPGPRRAVRNSVARQRKRLICLCTYQRGEQLDRTADSWFLSAEERDNSASEIDRRRGDGLGWTEGNSVTPLVHGATYFARLHTELSRMGRGDEVWFLDWRGDATQRLAGDDTELGSTLSQAL